MSQSSLVCQYLVISRLLTKIHSLRVIDYHSFLTITSIHQREVFRMILSFARNFFFYLENYFLDLVTTELKLWVRLAKEVLEGKQKVANWLATNLKGQNPKPFWVLASNILARQSVSTQMNVSTKICWNSNNSCVCVCVLTM